MSKNEKLQEYFNFTQSDLQANRQGQLTEEQQLLLKDKTNRLMIRGSIVAIFMLAVIAVPLIVVFRSAEMEITPIALIAPAISFAAVILLIVYRVGQGNKTALLTAEGKVNFVWVESQIPKSDRTGYTTEQHLKMRVGGVSFGVNEALMDIIDQGDHVRFYYTSGGDVVSAEFLEKPED